MPDYRAPSFLLVLAGAFVVFGFAAALVGGEEYLLWASVLVAFSPAFEWEMSRRSAAFVAKYYDRDADEIHRKAYRPLGSLLRCCFLSAFFVAAYGFGAGGLNLLPDNLWWVLSVILGPIGIYLIWVGVAYWRNASSVAKREGWRPAKSSK